MNMERLLGLPLRVFSQATLVGIAVGVVYTLSPLTVWFAAAIVPLLFYAGRGLDPGERRCVVGLLVGAMALQLIAVASLFLLTDHPRVPFGSFFGDEQYAVDRSLWLRNLALGLPLHQEDLLYAFEPAGTSSYLYLLALVQTLVGPAPYGLHLVGMLFYVLATVLLYRLIRPALGRTPALFGLTVLLFLPSLFAWSVSVLKEPLFVLLSAASLVCAVKLVRGSSWRDRALALAGIASLAAVLESVRTGGAAISTLGVLVGLLIAYVVARPRLIIAALVAMPIVIGAALSRPEVQFRTYVAVQGAARQHWGQVVVSQGYAYKLLDERLYRQLTEISDMRLPETMRFLARALAAYVTVPLPWEAQSRAAVAYLPEQMLWYVIVALAAGGLLFAFRRDALVTGLLLGHALVVAGAVAFTTGNVGTLVRHRGLVLPYLVWLAGVGACELLSPRVEAEPVRPPAMPPFLNARLT